MQLNASSNNNHITQEIFMLLSNASAATARWEDVSKVRKMMNNNGARKEQGCGWIEVKGLDIFIARN